MFYKNILNCCNSVYNTQYPALFLIYYNTPILQWVHGSDVVVAQSREQLCVWYNIDVPDRITTTAIKGEVTDVERADGKTEVLGGFGLTYSVRVKVCYTRTPY